MSEERKEVNSNSIFSPGLNKPVAVGLVIMFAVLLIACMYHVFGDVTNSKNTISKDDIYYHTEEADSVYKVSIDDVYKLKGEDDIFILSLDSSNDNYTITGVEVTESVYNKYIGKDGNAVRVKIYTSVLHFYDDLGNDRLVVISDEVYPWDKDSGVLNESELRSKAEHYIGRKYGEVKFDDYHYYGGSTYIVKPLFSEGNDSSK